MICYEKNNTNEALSERKYVATFISPPIWLHSRKFGKNYKEIVLLSFISRGRRIA